MKIDVCSDLHVPINGMVDWGKIKNKDSDILIVAGDMSDSVFKSASVLNQAAEHYRQVFAVMGNHDFYDFASPENGLEVLRSLTSDPSKMVTILGGIRASASIGLGNRKHIAIIGDTGWYDWRSHIDLGISEEKARDAWNSYMNDPRFIDFGNTTPQQLADKQARHIKREISDIDSMDSYESTIIVTHMIPRQDLSYQHPTNMIWNALTPSYVNTGLSDLSDVNTNKKVKYHIYGHTHMRGMKEINGITYLNNALGMREERDGWFMVQIEV